jgi:hypothetical protein
MEKIWPRSTDVWERGQKHPTAPCSPSGFVIRATPFANEKTNGVAVDGPGLLWKDISPRD